MPVSAATPSDDENPYASPRAAGVVFPKELPVAIWSQGDRIIAHREAAWPKICVKTGVPAEIPIQVFAPKSRLPFVFFFLVFMLIPLPFAVGIFLKPRVYPISWTIAVMVVCSAIVGSVMVLVLRRQGKLTIFVSESAARQRRMGTIFSTLFSIAMLASFAGSFLLPIYARFVPIWIGALCSVGMAIFARRWQTLLHPVNLGKQYIVLSGAGKPFLSQLPAWPNGPV